jgi:hypothetical protein
MKPMMMIFKLYWLEVISVAYRVPYLLLPLHLSDKVLALEMLFTAPHHSQRQYLYATRQNGITES